MAYGSVVLGNSNMAPQVLVHSELFKKVRVHASLNLSRVHANPILYCYTIMLNSTFYSKFYNRENQIRVSVQCSSPI